ncbi:hypothetical protein ACJ72_02329 [Emergomyces africanus]|uniref:Uncharacterized protein n=1 Tax=Emergomyces africanus TaxID=1955775 RepID=A0A1B7P2P6_9EURO|nr:hypothetical protein ACJ72_02329 [Emergomyces africanus]
MEAIGFYSSALKNAVELELPRVKKEIEALQAVLENLERLAQKGDRSESGTKSALPTLNAICVQHNLAPFVRDLEDLISRLNFDPQDDSKRKKLVQQLRWPLRKKETEQLILNIRRHTDSLVQALQTDQASITLDLKNMILRQQNLDTVLHNEDLHRNIDQWLSAVDPSSNYYQAKRKRHPNTALWLTQSDHFSKWKACTPTFCWLHGILGSGKTVISSAIVERVKFECSSNPSSALAYFYFDFSDPDKRTPDGMVRSLVKQFSHQYRSLPQTLVSLYKTSSKRNHEPDISELRMALRDIIELFDESFIVLDALDECSEISHLLHIINDILSNTSVKVHILATSRIIQSFEDEVDSLHGNIQKVPIDKARVGGDIRTFVNECLQTDTRFKRWKNYPDIQKDIESQTTSKANGMFQWAICQLEMLANCAQMATLYEALASPPKSLNAIYEHILHGIDLKWKVFAVKILPWLAFSARPLTIKELAEMFTINIDDSPQFAPQRRLFDPREILDMCSPLVIIDVAEGGDEVVRLAHLSVKELIVSNYLSSGPLSHYHISETSANVEMAEICLAYLLHVGEQTIVNDGVLAQFPLARYAARYWTHHLQTADTSTSIIQTLSMKLLSFDSPVYLNWVRLCDPERPTGEPNYRRTRGSICTPLYYMALTGLASLTELLLEDGNNGNNPGTCHATYGGPLRGPLRVASTWGHARVVKLLLSRGADVTLTKDGYLNNLRLATVGGHLEVVELFLEIGADIDTPGTLLYEAASGGHIDVVKLLLRRGQDPNALHEFHGTALQGACAYGYDQMVYLLLESGADVNIQGGLGGNALQAAAAKGNIRICRHLLSKGADPNSKGGQWCSALLAAAANGHLHIVDELLKNGAVVDMVDNKGGIPLQAALAKGHESVSHLLLSKGSNPSWKGGIYDNVLQAASLGGVISVVKLVVQRGVDVNSFGGKFGTALQAASSKGRIEVVEFLIEHGAEINIPGGYYGSALRAASSKGYADVVQVLLTHGAHVNGKVGNFSFAIQEAAVHNHAQVVQLLLENGADVNSSGGARGSWNILEFATRRGHVQVVRVILQWADDTHVQLNSLEAAREGALECGRDKIVSILNQ